ncbi:MAG: hypothetical protein U5L11_02230 [Arhodomonas sp.]|nr:hypothetical protein [Arhodomonas sp.]
MVLRSHHDARRHPPGGQRQATPLDAITRELGLGSYLDWSEGATPGLPGGRARQPPAADPEGLRARRGYPRGAGYLRRDG